MPCRPTPNAPAIAEPVADGVAQAGARACDASISRGRPLLGTLVSVQVWPDGLAAGYGTGQAIEDAIDGALACVAHISRVMSAHDPDSDLGRMSRARAGECLTLDAHTIAVLQASQYWHRVSGGAFSPARAAHALARQGRRPGLQLAVQTALQAHTPAPPLGLQHLCLLSPTELRMPGPVLLDLGGIAKGYAVDQAVACLVRAGVRQAVVNAGGDLRVIGPRAQAVQLRHAGQGLRDRPLPERCRLHNAALATSVALHAESEFVRTRPSGRQRWRSASVQAEDCMSADALTKWALQSSLLCPALRAALRTHRARLWRS